MLILEGRAVKRLSKRIRQHYFELKPGENWRTTFNGQSITIIAGSHNTQSLFAGRADQKYSK